MFGASDLFGSAWAEEVVIPLAAGDLIDGFVAEAGIVFEGGFVFGSEGWVDKLGIGFREGGEVERVSEFVKVAVGGVVQKVFDVFCAVEAFNFAEVKAASGVGTGSGEVVDGFGAFEFWDFGLRSRCRWLGFGSHCRLGFWLIF